MNEHERARELVMSERIDEISAGDHSWLNSHLASCDDCSGFAAKLEAAVGAVRMPSVMASASLVRATQSRVRRRAVDINAHKAAMRPLWIAVALVCGWATVTTPLLWVGFAWMGAVLGLSNVEWRTGFVFAWIAPTLTASLLLLASDSHRARWRMVLGPGTETL